MKEYILYASDGSPIYLSQKRWIIAKNYKWFSQIDGSSKHLITYFDGKSYSFSTIVFGKRIRRKDPSIFDYTKRNLILRAGFNSRNTRLGKYNNNTSGYYYVYKAGDKWMVTIRINNIAIYKGRYSDKEDADVVADYWSGKYAGVNAYLNFNLDRRSLKRKYESIMIKNGYSIYEFTK